MMDEARIEAQVDEARRWQRILLDARDIDGDPVLNDGRWLSKEAQANHLANAVVAALQSRAEPEAEQPGEDGLSRCAHCGADAEMIYAPSLEPSKADPNLATVKCTGCPVSLSRYGSPESVRKEWNRRTPSQDRREALEEAVMSVPSAVRDYLPSDGISEKAALNQIIEAVDNPRIVPVIREIENGHS